MTHRDRCANLALRLLKEGRADDAASVEALLNHAASADREIVRLNGLLRSVTDFQKAGTK